MSSLYPPSAFYFKVSFGSPPSAEDTSFQEVSGIASRIETEDVQEGGENRYVHRLPTKVTHPKLVVKRGIAEINSPLVRWCLSFLEGDLSEPLEPKPITVLLLDEKGDRLRGWSFENAYPVSWEVEGFNSTRNEVAIEKIEFNYNNSTRLI